MQRITKRSPCIAYSVTPTVKNGQTSTNASDITNAGAAIIETPRLALLHIETPRATKIIPNSHKTSEALLNLVILNSMLLSVTSNTVIIYILPLNISLPIVSQHFKIVNEFCDGFAVNSNLRLIRGIFAFSQKQTVCRCISPRRMWNTRSSVVLYSPKGWWYARFLARYTRQKADDIPSLRLG